MKKKCVFLFSTILCIAILGGCNENINTSSPAPVQQPTQHLKVTEYVFSAMEPEKHLVTGARMAQDM